MRTRFLNTDCLCSHSSSSSASQTLSFLHLPIPQLPPPSRFSGCRSEDYLLPSHPLPHNSPSIHTPPIDVALSNFISDVTPHFLQLVDYADAGSAKHETSLSQRDKETAAEDSFQVIQFEEPEPYALLGNSCFSEEQNQIISQLPEIKNDTDSPCPGLETQFLDKVHDIVYSVEDVTLECDIDQNAYALEDGCSIQEQPQFNHKAFPLFEVDETSLGSFINLSTEDDDRLWVLLRNIESQFAEQDILLTDGTELLSHLQYDVLEFLSNHCLSNQCLQSELASPCKLLGIDLVNMVESLPSEEGPLDCFLPINPTVFQDFKFLHVDSSQVYEVFFDMQTAEEPETCDWMFSQNMNFKNFEELIVFRELTLVDDAFKSLPVPVLSDHDKVRSVYAIIEEATNELEPQPLSASYGIYLDWHLLDVNKCSSKICSSTWSVLEEFGYHQIDSYWESLDTNRLVSEFIFSNGAINGPKMEGDKESFEALPQISDDSRNIEVASSKSIHDKCPKPANLGQVAQENSEKASSLFKTASAFNDLDFFLNPGKSIARQGKSVVTETSSDASFSKELESQNFLARDENVCNDKSEELPNLVPVVDNFLKSSEAADEVEACFTRMSVPYSAHSIKSGQTQEAMVSFPETIIIVNTQNFDKEMIVSRRDTYQKILAMEKEGAQVVERDLNLPVDIIVSSAICLVWYDCRNMEKKSSAADEASSCLPLWIENIATNVLTSLSFTFSSCLLVFEGEISFLSIIMESSDRLYAAAASLGIDLQIFCSHSSELTNEVMLSSISYAIKLYRGMYPKMHESETLAEHFLTRFPSINPLTAHAILSSVVKLLDFLEWSQKRRTLAVQHFHISDESLALFTALCRYGEREDSKSIMTDCTSSASSSLDSDVYHINTDPERKRQKRTHTPQKVDRHVDTIWDCEPLNQFAKGVKGASGSLEQNYCWTLTDPEIVDPLQWSSSSLRDWQGEKHKDIGQTMNLSNVMKPYGSQNPKVPLALDEILNRSLDLNDKLLSQDGVSVITAKNKCGWDDACKLENLHEKRIGEVIDLTDNSSWDNDIPSRGNSNFFSPLLTEMGNVTMRSKAARRLSFGKIESTPIASKTKATSNIWTTLADGRKTLQENYDPNEHHDKMPISCQSNLLKEILKPRSAGNSKVSPFKEEILHCGGTPLSKAVHSARPQPGSPWTMEFLNRIREKSRLRQQSLPCDTSSPPCDYSANISKPIKRSPSILEFFRYQGGTRGKMHCQTKPKQPVRPSSSQKPRTSAFFVPTWTPIDKRSKQTLSFEINDSGTQTRLVWSDGAHHPSKKFRNK
ncbi:hypothetical protein Tsubulata_043782 [Turnera subulata]|uniref:Protein SHORTAGE IN CHIASMATA 1 n=1 Tax=Turnera subulata TaxID=218843 RepID=A0A9Q0G4J8_9ROSI|nr:hypothetical protein Tsubulata_043782 [Turnera subulata]